MIEILLCTDENYAPYCAVVISSIIQNSKNSKELNFYILTPGLKTNTERLLSDMVSSYGANIDILTVSTKEFDSLDLKRFGLGSILRLFMHRYLPKNCEKVIYLDCDLLILDNISDLYSIDLENRLLGAVTDLCSPREYDRRFKSINYEYFNTGVLLVDLNKWASSGIGERAFAYLKNNINLDYPDQDALNHILAGDWYSLDLCWNFQPAAYTGYEKHYNYLNNRRQELWGAVTGPKIVHFIGGIKPWHSTCLHPLQDMFLKYSQQTPWPIYSKNLYKELNFKQKLRRILKCSKNRKRFNLIKKK